MIPSNRVATHPGLILLKEFLEPLGLSQKALAAHIGILVQRINEIVRGKTVYAPRQSNDRLLLGLKGSLNEYELELLRERALEARQAKARRGELVVSVPAGFVKTEDQTIEKDPDLRVQGAIQLAFDKVVELGTVRQTLLWFIEQDLELPVVDLSSGMLRWRRPSYSMLYRLLTHPAYGGAYAYGKTEQVICYDNGQARAHSAQTPSTMDRIDSRCP